MRMLVFEGTIDEIKEMQRELMRSGAPALAVEVPVDTTGVASGSSPAPGLTPGRPFVSTEVALRFLTRRPLSPKQRAVITAIYNSHPDGILATELQRQIGYTTSQFAGLMGAFGRRLGNTRGHSGYTWAFDNQWEAEHQCNRYRFPPSMREAIERADLV